MHCLSAWACDYADSGRKLAWPHLGAVREMKEHPDGTSKQPPDRPSGCRWGLLCSRAAVLVCHLNFSPTSPSLHVHVSALVFSYTLVIPWNGYKFLIIMSSTVVVTKCAAC